MKQDERTAVKRVKCAECGKIIVARNGNKKVCGSYTRPLSGCNLIRAKRGKKAYKQSAKGKEWARKNNYKYFVRWLNKNRPYYYSLLKEWRKKNPDYWKPQNEKRKAQRAKLKVPK